MEQNRRFKGVDIDHYIYTDMYVRPVVYYTVALHLSCSNLMPSFSAILASALNSLSHLRGPM